LDQDFENNTADGVRNEEMQQCNIEHDQNSIAS